MNEFYLVLIYALVTGLMIGSFLNVVIHRLPIMLMRDWRYQCDCLIAEEEGQPEPTPTTEKFNLAYPPSRCPACGNKIKIWQNIPLLSYLLLKGKCGHCGTSISLRYPIVELVTGLLTFFCIYFFGLNMQGLSACLITWCLISLTMIDYDHTLLPDNITLPLLWGGLLINYFGVFTSLENAVIGAMVGYLILWSIYWGFKLLSGIEGMGYGDFKLLAALGAWLGWQYLPIVILLSSVVGALVGVILIASGQQNKNKPIPFGPYLAVAGWITLMWGEQINTAYLSYLS